tara:strand:+ start:447 stop:740 length:294 start_codon:yes stop_codon:yes gene_type:complete
MKKSMLGFLLLPLAFSSVSALASVDCDKAVENQIAITKAGIDKSKPGASFFLKSLNSPGAKGKGVAQCKQDIKSKKGVKEWSCVESAKSMKALQTCD